MDRKTNNSSRFNDAVNVILLIMFAAVLVVVSLHGCSDSKVTVDKQIQEDNILPVESTDSIDSIPIERVTNN